MYCTSFDKIYFNNFSVIDRSFYKQQQKYYNDCKREVFRMKFLIMTFSIYTHVTGQVCSDVEGKCDGTFFENYHMQEVSFHRTQCLSFRKIESQEYFGISVVHYFRQHSVRYLSIDTRRTLTKLSLFEYIKSSPFSKD